MLDNYHAKLRGTRKVKTKVDKKIIKIKKYKKMMKETLISNFQCSKIQSILSQKGKTISNTSINK